MPAEIGEARTLPNIVRQFGTIQKSGCQKIALEDIGAEILLRAHKADGIRLDIQPGFRGCGFSAYREEGVYIVSLFRGLL